MEFLKLIQEGRVDDFKNKYGKKFSPEQITKIADSIQHKYLMWVGKVFDGINFDEKFPKLYNAINKFSKISTNLPKTDINQYQSLEELLNAISTYENRERRDVKRVEGGNVIYDDKKLFVVNPLDHKASCYYGRGTKWCTASENDTQFKNYNQDGKLFYIIDRTKPTNDPLYKVAFLRKYNGEKKFFDAKDEYVMSGWIFGTEELKKIDKAVDKYLTTEFAEQIKIYTDIELAKKEKERLRRLEIQRILTERRAEANERRLDGEWELDNPNISDIGLKANALLKWLESNGDITILTNEDRIEMQRISDEIEELQNEYNNSDGDRPELLLQIDDLEDELSEYENHIDVYHIIPTGEFYDTTEFEVIDGDVDDRRYAVGTDDEMRTSCVEYLEQLLDDIGVRGFNENFVRGFIDGDAVARYAEVYYEDSVRDSPESYLNEENRDLSESQEEEIETLENRIFKIEEEIDKFESNMGGNDDGWIEDKIEELRSMIDEYQADIEYIKENPDGDFPEHLIDEVIYDMTRDVEKDPESFLDEYGIDWSEFINQNDLIEGIIDADGYGHTLNSYDGNADEEYVNDELFYVMRID